MIRRTRMRGVSNRALMICKPAKRAVGSVPTRRVLGVSGFEALTIALFEKV